MDNPNSQRRESTTPSLSHHSISSAPSASSLRNVNPSSRPNSLTDAYRQPSIRIRRFPSYSTIQQQEQPSEDEHTGRRRSSSDPQRASVRDLGLPSQGRRRGLTTALGHDPLPGIVEGAPAPSPVPQGENEAQAPEGKKKKLRKHRGRLFRRGSNGSVNSVNPVDEEYENGLVDMLDLVDPEVSTLNTLTNVQNSLFVPNLGRFINRRPTYTLTRRDEQTEDSGSSTPDEEEFPKEQPSVVRPDMARQHTRDSITSKIDETHYAVLPHGVALEGWSPEDRQELNDHVRHMLHSRRSKFKRSMKGFRQYMSHPLGFFITLYATLITLFGLIWVLFLIGWIGLGSRKDYIVNIIDNVLVALFAIMGDGLAPFRIVDTYHMSFIWHYHHLTQKVRGIKSLPPLQNHNDLPTARAEDIERDVETGRALEKPGEEEFSVLTEEQQKKLLHHQTCFAKSHTFYKPHETATHHAFPIHFLIAAVILLDLHSCLQISLGACTWGISYHHRPFALTTVILCCSITVNITAGVVIMMGDRRTRKKDVLELMHKQELTAEAMRKLERKREKERKEKAELDLPVPPPLGVDQLHIDSIDEINYTSPRNSVEREQERAVHGHGSSLLGFPMIEADPADKKQEVLEKFPSV